MLPIRSAKPAQRDRRGSVGCGVGEWGGESVRRAVAKLDSMLLVLALLAVVPVLGSFPVVAVAGVDTFITIGGLFLSLAYR